MKIKCIVGLILISFLLACTPPPKDIDLSTFMVTMERTACFGPCPIYKVTIHGNGEVFYDGEQYVQGTGKKELRISEKDIQALKNEINKAGFFSLKDNYDFEVTDLPTTITTITLDGKTKSVRNYYGAPDRLKILEKKIDELSGISDLIKPTRFGFDEVIFLEKKACFGPCPVYEVAFYQDGHIEYEGFEHVNATGKLESTLDTDDFINLFKEILSKGFLSLEDNYLKEVEDAPTQTILIQYAGISKRITYNIDPPKVLLEIEDRINEVTGAKQLVGE